MPAFRKDIDSIGAYIPGLPIEDVMRDYGLTDIIKLASNECPEEPFAPVQEAIAAAAREVHRYPDNSARLLTTAIAEHHRVDPANVLPGPGSSPLLAAIAHAMGGDGSSAVYSEQSFVLYRIVTGIARAESITVPVTDELRLDAKGLAAAVRADTTVLYLCNPNNPTSTYVEPTAVDEVIDAVPNDVLVVVDEAYEEYVTHPHHRSALPHALTRDNVVVLRTFSKIYGLAGLRVGYGIGQAPTLNRLRRVQDPFAITSVSQAAAIEALRHQDLVAERAKTNARGRDQLATGLAGLGVGHLESQTNFLFAGPFADATGLCEQLLRRGVIVRQFGAYVRVTVGTEAENIRFIETMGDLL